MWKYIKPFLPYVILAGLFMFIEVSVDLIQPSIMLKIVDEGILGLNNGNLELIFRYGLQMIIIVIIGGLSGSLNNIFVHLSGQNIGNEIRKDSFRKIMSFSFSDVDLYSSGALVTRVTNDITQVQNFVSQFVRGMIRTMMQMFGSLFLMYQLNIHFGIIVTLAFPVIVGSLLYCMYKADPLFDRLQSSLDEINNILEEDLNGIRIIKACVKEVYEKIRFKKANNELIKTQLKVLIIFAFMNPVVNCLMYLVVALILWFGYQDVLSGFTTPGTIMAAITYTTQMLNGILMLNLLIQNISRGITSWKRIRKILNYEPSLRSGSYKDEPEVHGLIEIKNLSFSYNHSQKILYDINLKIYPGETLAIMGATGSGKTTLLNLICRFYDANEGEILIDGINIKDYDLSNLRKRISLVLQKSELFTQTIKQNIAWGNMSADNEQIIEAARTAQAHDFIMSFPDGYETMVEEKGASLSGGQKQRIAIARSLLKQAEIRIFDDATSALDLKTERKLFDALNNYDESATRIIVAQRISSVINANHIAVIDNGTIVGYGSHNELIKNCQIYKDIYNSQMSKEENDDF